MQLGLHVLLPVESNERHLEGQGGGSQPEGKDLQGPPLLEE